MLDKQRPVRKKIFAMDAYPSTYLYLVVTVKLSCKQLTCRDVKGSLLFRMARMQMWLLMAFPFLGAHGDEYAVEKRQSCHCLVSLCSLL